MSLLVPYVKLENIIVIKLASQLIASALSFFQQDGMFHVKFKEDKMRHPKTLKAVFSLTASGMQ